MGKMFYASHWRMEGASGARDDLHPNKAGKTHPGNHSTCCMYITWHYLAGVSLSFYTHATLPIEA